MRPWLPSTAAPFAPAGGDSEALQRYPLYPYLQAARLSRQLALIRPVAAQPGGDPRLPLDDEIAAFLAQQGDRPVTRKLRSAWLAHLAERQAWSTYVGQYREDRDTQSTLRCHWLAARVALGQVDGLEAELTDTWLTAKSLPDACDPALAWWRARGGPGDVMVERRARLALEAGEAGLARFLAKSLPAARASSTAAMGRPDRATRARDSGADRTTGEDRRATGARGRLVTLRARGR